MLTGERSVTRLVLQRMEFYAQHAISKHELSHIAEIVRDDDSAWARSMWADEMCLTIRAMVWCKDKKTELHEYPTTWWDAVKLRFFPQWALRRWPANVTRVEVTRGTIYPELPTIGKGYEYGDMRIAQYTKPCAEEDDE